VLAEEHATAPPAVSGTMINWLQIRGPLVHAVYRLLTAAETPNGDVQLR